jgi:Ca2+-transporting ATPase
VNDFRPDSEPSWRSGLGDVEAAARLRLEGPNALPGRDSRGLAQIVLQTLREPMFALLLAAGLVYLAVGDPKEAGVLMVFACLSVGIAVVQEFRSERVLAALRDLSAPTSIVIRQGERRRIASTDLVRGDTIALSEGERVPADAILREGDEVQLDESLLTGESVPVAKQPSSAAKMGAPGGEDTPFLFSGSLMARGQALAEVAATGPGTELGRLGRSLQAITDSPSKLTVDIRGIVRGVGAAALIICALVVVLFGVARGAWLQGMLAGISLGMAMLPEEFPLVLTVFMVMGAWRLSRVQVLTKRASAIETLGSATVLCTDKTGTLTQNRMTLVAAWLDGRSFRWSAGETLPGAARPLARASLLSSAAHPFDPMERAFHDACAGWFAPADEQLRLDRTFGLTRERMAVSQIWARDGSDERRIACKGAPEAVVRMCGLSAAQAAEMASAVEDLARDGARVLAVAEGRSRGDWNPDQGGLTFLGLVGLADPLRGDVAEAIGECRAAGVRVVMVTGDYPTTARAIAREAGIADGATVTGAEIETMSDAELAHRARDVTVFARILPDQKLRIVRALQAAGDVVAMTGDGVNDAPALKAADIGVAMGARGTDVARSAADLVLLDDSFASIVRGMRLGRRIYDNLQKAMGFILAVHVPIAGLALLPLLFGLPIFLVPAHIAFLEMIIDPVCSVVFEVEREEADLMRRPPRDARARLFTSAKVAEGLLQGVLALGVVVGVYLLAQRQAISQDSIRAVAFVALVLSVFGLVLANRARGSLLGALITGNRVFVLIFVAVMAAVAGVMWSGALRDLFHFGPVGPSGWSLAIAGGICCLVVLEALKQLLRLRPATAAPG